MMGAPERSVHGLVQLGRQLGDGCLFAGKALFKLMCAIVQQLQQRGGDVPGEGEC